MTITYKELMDRLDASGIGHAAEIISICIEPAATLAWAPPPAPGTAQPDKLTVVVRA